MSKLTTEQRAVLARVAKMPKMDRRESAAIRAALAEIDRLTEHDRLAAALCNEHAATIDAQDEELELLRMLADAHQCELGCDPYTDDCCDLAVWRRRWRKRFGKGGAS